MYCQVKIRMFKGTVLNCFPKKKQIKDDLSDEILRISKNTFRVRGPNRLDAYFEVLCGKT